MGYIKHDAIVVTSFCKKKLTVARKRARMLGLYVTNIATGPVNGYCSFTIIPDGSKEGWEDSNHYEALRNFWVEWARDKRTVVYGYIDWIAVRFGGDGPSNSYILDHNKDE